MLANRSGICIANPETGHSYRGGRSPAELLQRLWAAPTPPGGLDPETLTELVNAQVRLLRTLLATIADLDRAIGAALLGHQEQAPSAHALHRRDQPRPDRRRGRPHP
jgi:hypothetical protein